MTSCVDGSVFNVKYEGLLDMDHILCQHKSSFAKAAYIHFT